MFFLGFGIDEKNIKIDGHQLIKILHEDRIHEARESGWSISEAKDNIKISRLAPK